MGERNKRGGGNRMQFTRKIPTKIDIITTRFSRRNKQRE